MADGGGQALQGLAAIGASVKRTAAGADEAAPVPQKELQMRRTRAKGTPVLLDAIRIPADLPQRLRYSWGDACALNLILSMMDYGFYGVEPNMARMTHGERLYFNSVLRPIVDVQTRNKLKKICANGK